MRDDFPASTQHEVAVLVPHQSDGETRRGRKINRKSYRQSEERKIHRIKQSKTERDKYKTTRR